MTPIEHGFALLLCTFAAWATIGAIRRNRDDTGTTRIKLAALIAGPPLLLLLAGVPFLTVVFYYLVGFVLTYGLIYGLTLAIALNRYGLENTLRAITNLYGTSHQHQPPQPEPDEPVTARFDDPTTDLPADDPPEPHIFKDQK